MYKIFLTNTLTKKKEEFIPINPPNVGIYSCGPTVYWNQHIGHMYAYVQWDTLVRFLRYLGYKVKWVMNITDVGHMTSDEDFGEDKMEKGARREGISVWDLAEKYINQFLQSLELLNVVKPDVLCRATQHIDQQIKLASLIEKNGYTYKTKMGLVFDTSKFAKYSDFANLDLSKLKKRKDVEDDLEKKNPWDFFLWVTGNPKHIMQWDSPWGKGYPGWHLECTAMSTYYLGNNFDIHTGGIDHIPVHHTNEIAQGYAAFGRQTANYWLHNALLTGKEGEKMSKSLGNYVTVSDLIDKGYHPLALRYLFYTSHYRKGLRFSFEALGDAQNALNNLRELMLSFKMQKRTILSNEKQKKVDEFRQKFISSLADDLNVPRALATLWETVKSNIPSEDKYDLLVSFDEVFGLGLEKLEVQEIPKEIINLVNQREELRKKGEYLKADKIRDMIKEKGFLIEDSNQGPKLKPIKTISS